MSYILLHSMLPKASGKSCLSSFLLPKLDFQISLSPSSLENALNLNIDDLNDATDLKPGIRGALQRGLPRTGVGTRHKEGSLAVEESNTQIQSLGHIHVESS